MLLDNTVLNVLSEYFATKAEFNKFVADLKEKPAIESASKFSIARMVRGLAAMRGAAVVPTTAEQDAAYVKALSTGATTGSYLVPTIHSPRIIELLSDGGALRRLAPMIWPMDGVQNMNVPVESSTPTVEWLGQNTAQSASDPGFAQVALSLKTARSLTAIPVELLRSASPAADTVIERLIAKGFANKEDAAFFATSSQANGPASVYATSGLTDVIVGGGASGGDVAYADLVAAIGAAYTAEATPPFKWAFHPTVFFNKIWGLVDDQGRPIVVQDVVNGVPTLTLMGFPVVLSAKIPTDQAVGSGSNQSFGLFTNPDYIHVGQSSALEIAYSDQRYFDVNQIAIRGVRYLDYGYGPKLGIVRLKGINTL